MEIEEGGGGEEEEGKDLVSVSVRWMTSPLSLSSAWFGPSFCGRQLFTFPRNTPIYQLKYLISAHYSSYPRKHTSLPSPPPHLIRIWSKEGCDWERDFDMMEDVVGKEWVRGANWSYVTKMSPDGEVSKTLNLFPIDCKKHAQTPISFIPSGKTGPLKLWLECLPRRRDGDGPNVECSDVVTKSTRTRRDDGCV